MDAEDCDLVSKLATDQAGSLPWPPENLRRRPGAIGTSQGLAPRSRLMGRYSRPRNRSTLATPCCRPSRGQLPGRAVATLGRVSCPDPQPRRGWLRLLKSPQRGRPRSVPCRTVQQPITKPAQRNKGETHRAIRGCLSGSSPTGSADQWRWAWRGRDDPPLNELSPPVAPP
jgi:hypothetical protein